MYLTKRVLATLMAVLLAMSSVLAVAPSVGFAEQAADTFYAFYCEDDHSLNFTVEYPPENYICEEKLVSISYGQITADMNEGVSQAHYPWEAQCDEIEKVDTYARIMLPKNCNSFMKSLNIVSLDTSKWDTSQVENMKCMFAECHELKSLDLTSFDTSKVKDFMQMFYNCNALEELDLSSFDTSQDGEYVDMFSYCWELRVVYADIDKWVPSTWAANFDQDYKLGVVIDGEEVRHYSGTDHANPYASYVWSEETPYGLLTDIRYKPVPQQPDNAKKKGTLRIISRLGSRSL